MHTEEALVPLPRPVYHSMVCMLQMLTDCASMLTIMTGTLLYNQQMF